MNKDIKRNPALPKAIIFDLDDTLVHSTIEFMKFREKLLSYIEDKVEDMSGYSMRETTVSMIARFEKEMTKKGLDKRKIETYLDEIDAFLNEVELENIEKTVPIPGAEALLRSLKEKKVKIGVLTRGSPEYAKRALRIAGLDGFIDAIVARDRKSGIKPKPSPESALAIAKMLGVRADEAIMVGDYSIDYICAKDADLKFYGIASDEESRISLKEAGCRNILSGFEELRERIGL